MTLPTVAVLVRLYENERTIREALSSVFTQDYQGRIVVRFALDLGSRDRTHQFAREYADAHTRDGLEWVVSTHEHMTLRKATEWLIPQVEEDCAYFLDGDNYWFTSRLRVHQDRYPFADHRAVCGLNYLSHRVSERDPDEIRARWDSILPEDTDLYSLLRGNIMDVGAACFGGSYLRDRLAPAFATIVIPEAYDDYFPWLVAAWDGQLCVHNTEPLWVYRLVGMRPWEDPQHDKRGIEATREAFLSWTKTHPPISE